MTDNNLQKFPLSRSAEERLKIFYIITRPITTPQIMGEKVHGVLCYRPEDAMATIKRSETLPNRSIVWTGHYDFVDEIIGKVKGRVPGGVVEKPSAPKEKDLPTKQQFLWNLQLVNDEMTKGVLKKEDKESLKRIIKIVYDHTE